MNNLKTALHYQSKHCHVINTTSCVTSTSGPRGTCSCCFHTCTTLHTLSQTLCFLSFVPMEQWLSDCPHIFDLISSEDQMQELHTHTSIRSTLLQGCNTHTYTHTYMCTGLQRERSDEENVPMSVRGMECEVKLENAPNVLLVCFKVTARPSF